MRATSRRRASQQRAAWDDRVLSWSEQVEASEPFARIRDTIFELADPRPTDRCVDLGAGAGFITLPLAPCPLPRPPRRRLPSTSLQ